MGVFNGYKFVRLSEFCHIEFFMGHSIGVSLKFEEFLFKIQYLTHPGSQQGMLYCVSDLLAGML